MLLWVSIVFTSTFRSKTESKGNLEHFCPQNESTSKCNFHQKSIFIDWQSCCSCSTLPFEKFDKTFFNWFFRKPFFSSKIWIIFDSFFSNLVFVHLLGSSSFNSRLRVMTELKGVKTIWPSWPDNELYHLSLSWKKSSLLISQLWNYLCLKRKKSKPSLVETFFSLYSHILYLLSSSLYFYFNHPTSSFTFVSIGNSINVIERNQWAFWKERKNNSVTML